VSVRSQAARIAALDKWTHADPVAGTAAARATFLERFEDEVDPDRELPEAERLRRAKCARSAYFARLALLSAKARRQKKSAKNAAAPAPSRRPAGAANDDEDRSPDVRV